MLTGSFQVIVFRSQGLEAIATYTLKWWVEIKLLLQLICEFNPKEEINIINCRNMRDLRREWG